MLRIAPPAAALVACLAVACTPKAPVADTAEAPDAGPTTPGPQAPEVELSPCPNWTQLPNEDQVSDNYVIYRDFLRTGEVQKAYDLWQEVYQVAPAADGQRNTVITDGIYFAQYFASQTDDAAEQAAYRDQVFGYYDQLEECFPTDGTMTGRRAFDYFYTYPGTVSDKEVYDLFKQAIAEEGMDVGDYIINPLASLTVSLYEAGEIDEAEAKETVDFLFARIDKGMADATTSDAQERMGIIEEYAPQRLAYFETVEGFYDCDYFKDKYLPDFDDARGDYVELSQLAGYLKYGGCPADDPQLAQVIAAANEVRPAATASGPLQEGFDLLKAGRYRDAVAKFEEAYESSDNPERKAQIALIVAKVNYGNLKRYSVARTWARRAAEDKSNWGEPYLLIGKLYASSGPLCGSGTGFESQRVVWPAIDQWQRAKSVDPAVAGEANQLIAQYTQYMPAQDDIFMKGLSVGSSYTVDCWINETTTVRGK